MTGLCSFALAVLADLSAAGAFADWLQDRDDPRAERLRARWRVWQADRRRAEALDVGDAERVMPLVLLKGSRISYRVYTADALFHGAVVELFLECW